MTSLYHQWGQQTPLSGHMYCVAVTLKMTEQVEQQICIKFCVKLEHSSVATKLFRWFRRPQLWATGDWQLHHDMVPIHASYLVQCSGDTSNHPGDSAPLQPRFGTLWLLAFLKTKITFEREEISDCWWNSGKYDRAADGNWENCVRSQGAYFKRGLRHHCPVYNDSCVFFNKCLYFSFYMTWYLLDRRLHTHTHFLHYNCKTNVHSSTVSFQILKLVYLRKK